MFSFVLIASAFELTLKGAIQATWSNESCPVYCTCSAMSNDISIATTPNLFEEDELLPNKTIFCEHLQNTSELENLFRTIPSDVTSFSLKNSGITTISDFPSLSYLLYLDLSENSITNILAYESYASFDRVQRLNLAFNNLTRLRREEFVSFPKLHELDLSHNGIEHIELETFRQYQLKRLYLNDNRLAYVNEKWFRFTPFLELLYLSGNLLNNIHARNFYYISGLRTLNLSNNHLSFLSAAAFEPLYELQTIDLSFNLFVQFPTTSLLALENLKSVNFDGNLISRLSAGAIERLNIKTLSVCNSSALHMIVEDAIRFLPHLETVRFADNANLAYLSPRAIRNVTMLKYVNLARNNLSFIPEDLFQDTVNVTEVDITGNPLSCECFSRQSTSEHFQKLLINVEQLTCKSEETKQLFRFLDKPKSITFDGAKCVPNLYPWHNLSYITVRLGYSVLLYCVIAPENYEIHDKYKLSWILPDNSLEEKGSFIQNSSTLPQDLVFRNEGLEIVRVTERNNGLYRCRLSNRQGTVLREHFIHLMVLKPDIFIEPFSVSGHHVTLHWNQSKQFTDLGDFFIWYRMGTEMSTSKNSQFVWKGGESLQGHWRSISLYELSPLTNYTICMRYTRHNRTLYQQCFDLATDNAAPLPLGRTLNYTLIGLLCTVLSLVLVICTARCVHQRYHIWQREKCQSRMQCSISAEGFFTSQDSLKSGGSEPTPLAAITYENMQICESYTNCGTSIEQLNLIEGKQITDLNGIELERHYPSEPEELMVMSHRESFSGNSRIKDAGGVKGLQRLIKDMEV